MNAKDSNGWTALMHACEQGCTYYVEKLLEFKNIRRDVCDGIGKIML